MLATIIISIILAGIVAWVIYRMVQRARSGHSTCVGCGYADTCAAAKMLPKKKDCDCPQPLKAGLPKEG